jgi:hypothetical protein
MIPHLELVTNLGRLDLAMEQPSNDPDDPPVFRRQLDVPGAQLDLDAMQLFGEEKMRDTDNACWFLKLRKRDGGVLAYVTCSQREPGDVFVFDDGVGYDVSIPENWELLMLAIEIAVRDTATP